MLLCKLYVTSYSLHSNNYTDMNNTVSQKQKFASSTQVQHLDIALHISYDYSLLILDKHGNSPFKATGNRNVQQDGRHSTNDSAMVHSSDDRRRVSQLACCYHAMTVGHGELRNDGHQMAVSCYSDRSLRNDLPPGDVDGWRRSISGLNVCTVTCLEGDVLVTLPDPVEWRPLSTRRAAEVSASALADMTPWSIHYLFHVDCTGLVTSHRTASFATANDWI